MNTKKKCNRQLTNNLDDFDEACDLNYIPNHNIKHETTIVMSNGFGGHKATLLMKKYSE